MRMTVKKTIISDLLIFLYFCVILGDALNLGILNMITLGAFAYYFISGGKGLKSLGRSPYFLWLVIFTGYIFLGMIWASSRASAFNMGKTFLKMSIMMFFVYLNTTSLEKLIFRIKQFLCATVFMMAKVLLSYFSGASRLNAFSSGTGLHFNSVAQILAFSIILAFWFVLNYRAYLGKKHTWVYGVYIVAAYLMIVWSGSRKSILMPIVGMLLILVFGEYGIQKKIRYFIIFFLVILAAGYVVISNNALFARFIDLYTTMFKGAATDVSEIERKYYRETAWMLFKKSPILGFGADGFMEYLKQIGYSHIAYCHNNWLEILSAYGVVGGFLYYWYYVHAIVKLKKKALLQQRMGVVLLSIVIVLFVFEYGIVTYYFPMYHLLFCFIAIFIQQAKEGI